MFDIEWDITANDIVTVGSGSTLDFATTSSQSILSTQNAGIILIGRGFNITAPQYGVAISEIINGSETNGAAQMNRWKAMCLTDGAASAVWSYKPAIQEYEWDSNYPN